MMGFYGYGFNLEEVRRDEEANCNCSGYADGSWYGISGKGRVIRHNDSDSISDSCS
jgi:hypothetical protein